MHACPPVYRFSRGKQYQSRDTADYIGVCDLGLGFHVHFSNGQGRLRLLHHLQYLPQPFAGTAPVRVEIHKYRDIALKYFRFEIVSIKLVDHSGTPFKMPEKPVDGDTGVPEGHPCRMVFY
jgi:hypothetical protein